MAFQSYGFSNEVIGVKVKGHTTEFSIEDNEVAKALFKRLPVYYKPADLVHGLLLKNDRYLFCVREPSRNYHCHFYLKGHGAGELSSFWKDVDYGKGSLEQFIETSPIAAKAVMSIKDNSLVITVEGKMADNLFEQLDLAKSSFHVQDGVRYEKRVGRKMNCVRLEFKERDHAACRIFVPFGKPPKKNKDPNIQLL